MKRLKIAILINILLLLLSSCLTTDQPISYNTYSFDRDDTSIVTGEVDIPEVHLFVSAPFKAEPFKADLNVAQIILPNVDVPKIKESLPIAVAPVKTKSAEVPVKTQPAIAPVAAKTKNDTTEQSQSAAAVPKALPAIAENAAPEELKAAPGEEIKIVLDKEGWIFGGSSDGKVKLVSRDFADGKTVFHLETSEEGQHTITFTLQNLSTGNEDTKTYSLKVSPPAEDNSSLPVIINSGEEEISPDKETGGDETISQLIKEKNVPGLVASLDSLLSDDDPGCEVLKSAFDLLDGQGGYLSSLIALAEDSFKLYPYNDYSAEMLFRAAQAVEQPGADQDIEKAIELFKDVRDYYPLSTYSDKAVDRIRYLERHFMKIY